VAIAPKQFQLIGEQVSLSLGTEPESENYGEIFAVLTHKGKEAEPSIDGEETLYQRLANPPVHSWGYVAKNFRNATYGIEV
jgi:hypothetical protein